MGFVQVEVTHAHTPTHTGTQAHALPGKTSCTPDAFTHHITTPSLDLFEELIERL